MTQRENASGQSTRRQFLGLGVAGVASALVGGAAITQAGTPSGVSPITESILCGDTVTAETQIRFNLTEEQRRAFLSAVSFFDCTDLPESEHRAERRRRIARYLRIEKLPIERWVLETRRSATKFVNDEPELGPVGITMIRVGDWSSTFTIYTNVSIAKAVLLMSEWQSIAFARDSGEWIVQERDPMPMATLLDIGPVKSA